MSTSINTNVTAMAAIRSLSMIATETNRTQARVESGLRVNKANDDPAVFAIAQNMRADLNAMTAVKDSLAFGKSALTVARDAATKISDELGKLKQTVTQGQQQGLDINQINTQITNALANIDAYAGSANFNGVNLVNNGTVGALTVVRDITGASTSIDSVDITTGAGGLNLTGLNVNSGAWELSFDNTLAIADGSAVSVTVGTETFRFEFNVDTDIQSLAGTNDTVRVVDYVAGDSNLARLGKLIDAMRGEGINANFSGTGTIIVSNVTTVANGGNGTATTVTGATAAQITGATGAIAVVEGAIDTVGSALATLGAAVRQVEGLQEFTMQLFDSVKEGLGSIVDADLAEESARLTSLQTKQQLAVQSLSIANQAPQALLNLFRG
jgi:flagellin